MNNKTSLRAIPGTDFLYGSESWLWIAVEKEIHLRYAVFAKDDFILFPN